MNNNTSFARTEFAAAINQICEERNIPVTVVVDAVKSALIASFEKDFPAEAMIIAENEEVVVAELDSDSGEFKLKAGKADAPATSYKDVTPPGFGRIAAQTAKQVILQQIREAEKAGIISEYQGKLGEVVAGMVQRMDGRNVIIDLGRGAAMMPPEEQVRTEYYRLNSRLSVVLLDIRETFKGQQIIVSRSDPKLVSALFAREVPEVGQGSVVISAIAREAGNRTKIAVTSNQEGVDPVGSCVGQKGVRVQAVINELNGEKIDIIQFSDDKDKFLRSAIAPAEALKVEISSGEDEATITVPHDQLSLAIGRGGTNVKLAARLAKMKVRVVSDQTDPGIAVTGEEEYEIDQLGLEASVREALVAAGFTRIEDFARHLEDIAKVSGVTEEVLEFIKGKLAAYQPSTPKV